MGNKGALIMLGELVVGAVAGLVIDGVIGKSKKKASSIVAAKVATSRSSDDQDKIDILEGLEADVKQIRSKEDKEVREKVREYRDSHDLKDVKNRLYSAADTAVKDLTEALDFEGNSARIRKEAERAIEKYKNDISYDDKLSEIELEIDDVEREYEHQKAIVKMTSSDEETAKTILKNFKKSKKDKIAALESKKHMLEERFEAFEKRTNDHANEEIDKIQSVIDRKRDDLYSEVEKKLKAIDEELSETSKKARHAVEQKRSMLDQSVLSSRDRYDQEVKDIYKREARVTKDTVDAMSDHDKLVMYLKDRDISKGTVWFFGLAPLVFIAHAIGWWVVQVAKVATAVAKS